MSSNSFTFTSYESSEDVIFTPVQGSEANIQAHENQPGWLYFATDTGKIYLDAATGERITLGGSGASIYYGNGQAIEDKVNVEQYYLPIDCLEDKKASPKVGDIILNSDGAFYKILRIESSNFVCSRLAVSGSGDGTVVQKIRPTIRVTNELAPNIINGQNFIMNIKVDSFKYDDGTPYDQSMVMHWKLTNTVTGIKYEEQPLSVEDGEEVSLDLTDWLHDSTSTEITVWVSGTNHEYDSNILIHTVVTSELSLSLRPGFSPLDVFKNPNQVILPCQVVGNVKKKLIYYLDDEVVDSEVLAANAETNQSCTLDPADATHGHHSVRIELYFVDSKNKVDNASRQFIEFEIAIARAGVETPIIWFGDYKNNYYNYDSIIIPYSVYDPKNLTKTKVSLKKAGIEYNTREVPGGAVKYDNWEPWEIANASVDQVNNYSMSCGDPSTPTLYTERSISFEVSIDPNRSMVPVWQEYLNFEFNPAGRSNDEPASQRGKWVNEKDGAAAILEGFNWYNNGWILNSATNISSLKISNGASAKFPIGMKSFNPDTHTIEIMFKVSNIQKYDNLVTNITRYQNDGDYWNEFSAPDATHGFTNYDSFLQWKLQGDYDKLKYDRVDKVINLQNAICKYLNDNNNGICVGVQDMFFTYGANTINASFVENEIINLTFTYSAALNLIYIFVNGVITGVSNASGNLSINTNYLEFNSNLCDIDLYKIRCYSTSFDVVDVTVNYAVDRKDINIFDQQVLAGQQKNSDMVEWLLDYNAVLKYYKDNPDKIQMPYIIFDTSYNSSGKKFLPYKKDIDNTIKVEFINAPLDRAYASGELAQKAIDDGLCPSEGYTPDQLAEAVKIYYKHHCPSWTSSIRSNDRVNISVQGTSSEFYPRRNYKIKTKMDFENTWNDEEQKWEEEDGLNIFLHKGPYAEIFAADKAELAVNPHYLGSEESRMSDGWYMDNYTNPTDRWTMKVDYMESSGSYNAGFASMVGSAYTKHPLQDYLNILESDDDKKTVANLLSPEVDSISTDLVDNNGIKWDDYRTSLLGFPVMAFWKKSKDDAATSDIIFIGYYRMLLDKGSDEVLGFKPSKKILHKAVNNEKLRDVAECWEFSTNARTFCSFRDPENRLELSFKCASYTEDDAPLVANHFEARYHKDDDALEVLMHYGESDPKDIDSINKNYGTSIPHWSEGDAIGRAAAEDLYLSFHKNWEDVCKWVWSTCTDNVPAQFVYSEIDLFANVYTPNTYYTYQYNSDTEEDIYTLATGNFNSNITYYEKTIVDGKDVYAAIRLTDNPSLVYVPYKYYIKTNNLYSMATGNFDPYAVYYQGSENQGYKKIADLLVTKATGTFDSTKTYYTYNGSTTVKYADVEGQPLGNGKGNGAVKEVQTPTADDFDQYYVASPVTWSTGIYEYDTKEYRTAKFIKELSEHFDIEYLATYFIMTEVFECYDSRGKNCMMATWGPQESNGSYIWYPIFYDIDTQLGINNTGIPSFEFNVDATEARNYSTSDSVLWNNFYTCFKNSYILAKYRNLKNINQNIFDTLDNPPLSKGVDSIEPWYQFDPNKNLKMIVCRGERPLIATNLDAYWKYITITNNYSVNGVNGKDFTEDDYYYGRWGYPLADGSFGVDNGGFFYALQGDRSQSRRQFLTNRLDYIDSWLNEGDYSRGGANRIRGRISANSTQEIISDKWMEPNDPYWVDQEYGTKTHEFDSEYWVNLTPIRSSYVTVGDDSAAYPSQKYDGENPIRFELTDLEQGIRTSPDYNEQLLYIYGMKNMADVGDLSKMYWREFYLEGQIPKLTRLKLGHDALSDTDNGVGWFNKSLNGINLPKDGINDEGLPLLKEANFCNIQLQTDNKVISLKKSYKLENFRATGSNIAQVNFAPGVVLNTLYLPASITSLELVHANLLDTLIKSGTNPTVTKDTNGNLVAPEGLYLEKFFGNEYNSNLSTLKLEGGALGYSSYDLMYRLWEKRTATTNLSLLDVNWCPYEQLAEGDTYDENATYYLNNNHYGFAVYEKPAEDVTEEEKKAWLANFNIQVLNGMVYKDRGIDNNTISTIGNDAITMLSDFASKTMYRNGDGTSHPEISGIIYINNDSTSFSKSITLTENDVSTVYTELNEEFIAKLQKFFPGLTLFFAKVVKSYSAKFIIQNEDGVWEYVDLKNNSSNEKIPSVQKIATYADDTRFTNPFELYNPQKTHYDFKGWSTYPTYAEATQNNDLITSASAWNVYDKALLVENNYDYTYYAIFTVHNYEIKFYNLNNTAYGDSTDADGKKCYIRYIPYGNVLNDNSVPMPSATDAVDLYKRNAFRGWVLKDTSAGIIGESEDANSVIIDLKKYTVAQNYSLYAVFQPEDVQNSATDSKYFTFTYDKGYPIIHLNTSLANNLTGKVTLPSKVPESEGSTWANRPILGVGNFASYNGTELGVNITHIFFMKDAEYKYIEDNAFKGISAVAASNASKLEGVYLPETIISIGEYAFQYKFKLRNITLPDSITTIKGHAFEGAPVSKMNLSIKKLPKSLTTIGSHCFRYNDGMAIQSIPDGVSELPNDCFTSCESLNIIEFGGENSQLKSIGTRCFKGSGQTQSISRIYLHDTITIIDDDAFEGYGIAGGPDIYTEHSYGDVDWDINAILNTENTTRQIHYEWNGII